MSSELGRRPKDAMSDRNPLVTSARGKFILRQWQSGSHATASGPLASLPGPLLPGNLSTALYLG